MNDTQDNATTHFSHHSLISNESEDEELGIPFSTDDDSSTNLTDALTPVENLPIETLPPPEENFEV